MMIAIDTGGTKTLIAKFDSAGQILAKTKIATPRDQTEYIAALIYEMGRLLQDEKPEAISIALPGVIRDQVAVVCKNLEWYDFDIIAKLRPSWPGTPIFLENDANLGGVGAANLLLTKPDKLLYITLSTGVGGGFIVKGEVDPSLANSEFGDLHLEYDHKMTNWENIASGRAVYDIYPEQLSQETEPSIKQEIAKRVARGLLALLPILRPDVVAIGGGFGAKYTHIQEFVSQELAALPDQYIPDIITAPSPEEIVAYGCYYHARNKLSI